MQDALLWFQGLTVDELAQRKTETLKCHYLRPGDVLYLPPGALVTEKAVGEHNVVLRAYTPVVADELVNSMVFIAGSCGIQNLGSLSMSDDLNLMFKKQL